MTSICAFATSDAMHVYADGSYIDERTGKVVRLGNKLLPLVSPSYFAVLSAAGRVHVSRAIEAAMFDKHFSSLESLADAFGSLIQDKQQKITDINPAMAFGEFRAVLAGWSVQRDAPVCVKVNGYAEGGVPAFTPTHCSEYINPAIPDFQFDSSDPAGSGLALLEKQRDKKWGLNGNSRVGAYVIGGFAQHAVITREGIATRILRCWPDKVGERILPASAAGTFGNR